MDKLTDKVHRDKDLQKMFLAFETYEKALIKKVPRISVIARQVRRERRKTLKQQNRIRINKQMVTETSSISESVDLSKEEQD